MYASNMISEQKKSNECEMQLLQFHRENKELIFF